MSPPPRGAGLKYTPASWADVGTALAVSVLDITEANPASRLGPSGGDGLHKLRGTVSAWVRTQGRKAGGKGAGRPKAARAQTSTESSEEDSDGGGARQPAAGRVGGAARAMRPGARGPSPTAAKLAPRVAPRARPTQLAAMHRRKAAAK